MKCGPAQSVDAMLEKCQKEESEVKLALIDLMKYADELSRIVSAHY